ncbi:MAG: carbohydrate ABC transporter permease [Bacilli bacterium]|nr:carbohydrate ABC transporter permease [Bacilli bacterium]
MKRKTKELLLKLLVLFVVLLIFTPIFLMIPAMFKDKYEIFGYPWTFLPQQPTLDNFRRIAYLHYTSIGIKFFNSMLMTMLVASLAVIFSLAINMIAAFAFARLRFPFKKTIWVIIISTMFIPGITILLTSIRVVSMLGMLDTIGVLVIPGLVSAYNIFFFRQFYLGFPVEIDEAAKIDGAKTYQLFTSIYFPMSKTPMIIIGASIFMGYYNSYLWPTLTLSYDRKDLFQIMYVIRMLFGDSAELGYGSVLAATAISLIPPLLIFVFVQKYIREGIQLSGLK